MNERLVTNILRPIHFPETTCNNQPLMQHHIPKEQRPQLHSCKVYKLTRGVAVPGCSNISWVMTTRPDKRYILFQQAKLPNYQFTKHSAESQGLFNSEDEGSTIFGNIRIPAYHTPSQPNVTQPNLPHFITTQETESSATLLWDPQILHYYILITHKVYSNYQDQEQCTG